MWALIALTAHAQMRLEVPQEVSHDVAEPDKTRLLSEKDRLATSKTGIEGGVAALNSECSRVDTSDVGKVADCRSRNQHLRQAIDTYKRELAAYKCALAEPAIAALKESIAGNQEAIRKIGLDTTAEAYERLGEMTKEQLHEFEEEIIEATFSAIIEVVKLGTVAAASTGAVQGRHYVKYAKDLGIDNPHVLEGIEAFANVRGKPEQARALNHAIEEMKVVSLTSFHGLMAGGSKALPDQAWHLAAIALVMTEDMYPQLAQQLAKKFPSLAVGVLKKITVRTGVAVAAPLVSFSFNMWALGRTNDVVQQLDLATAKQLDAVKKLHERMRVLVDRLKVQRATLSRCPA